jgi:hypothetical protein
MKRKRSMHMSEPIDVENQYQCHERIDEDVRTVVNGRDRK